MQGCNVTKFGCVYPVPDGKTVYINEVRAGPLAGAGGLIQSNTPRSREGYRLTLLDNIRSPDKVRHKTVSRGDWIRCTVKGCWASGAGSFFLTVP